MFKLVGGNCFNSESIFYSWLISNNDIISSLNWYKNLFGNIIDYSKFNIITDAELCETLKIGNLNDNTIKEHKHIINERTNKEEYSIKNMSNDDLDALKSKITELSKKLELRDIEIESLQKKIDVYKEVLSWTD
jgi:GTPase involved in cell partitioning and DNA repair